LAPELCVLPVFDEAVPVLAMVVGVLDAVLVVAAVPEAPVVTVVVPEPEPEPEPELPVVLLDCMLMALVLAVLLARAGSGPLQSIIVISSQVATNSARALATTR